ncbi:MAG: hypothetical protein ACM3PE_09275 [Deltaproteobacteria bacterium]
MNDTTKTAMNLGIGLVIVAVTLIVFFVGFSAGEKTTLDWLSLIFVLVAEIALIIGMIYMPLTQPGAGANLIRMGVLTTLLIYLAATVIMWLFAHPVFGDNRNGFITTQIVILGSAATVIMALMTSASSLSGKEGQDEGGSEIIKNSMMRVFTLKTNPDNQVYAQVLEQLYDEFKYCDHNKSLAGMDQSIETSVLELAEYLAGPSDVRTQEEVEARTDKIIAQIKERNLRLKQ